VECSWWFEKKSSGLSTTSNTNTIVQPTFNYNIPTLPTQQSGDVGVLKGLGRVLSAIAKWIESKIKIK